ncbi:hypothetical protein MYCTH_2020046, partial [Thermothelomyces thermophilus ATCC 42464]
AATAAVVVIPGGAEPKPYTGPAAVASEDDYFRGSAPYEFFNNSAELLLMSLSPTAANLSAATGLQPSADSFVRGAIEAWGEHLHLVVRPDEVWLTILVQVNFCMISHAEEVCSLFVDREGREEIYIKDLTWYDVLLRFKDEIQKRVKKDWLLDWIVPDYSTATESDVMTANVLMMGLTQAYFKYVGKQVCGIPSVTLLGERADWDKLLAQLDRRPPLRPSNARDLPSVLRLDYVDYPVLDLSFAPVGYARVPFIVKDFGGRDKFPAYVAAGALGKQITQGAPPGYEEALTRLGDPAEAAAEHATLRPLSGWMLYGAVEHNVTQPALVLEDGEMTDILFNAKRYKTEETCGVLGEP